ncbi:MAG TPA: type I methionyl aminopeptidase [Candidatus Paceibacterota bacterium]|nr:type I methionyl aminopeptidase [Candidatus Paceibacterota bacterium]
MITIKTKEDIEILREGGRHLASIFEALAKEVRPGTSTKEIDKMAFDLIKKAGGKPAFLNYKPEGVARPYPASVCTSIDDEVVHGIPSEKRILKEGEILSLDIGLLYKGLFTDMAVTVPVGEIDSTASRLLRVTERALMMGTSEARPGHTVGDIGAAIENYVKREKFTLNKVLAGHGVGYALHEDPYIPNFGKRGEGVVLKPGMVIALEPMVNEGEAEVYLADDGYTFLTKDGKRSAHFEHTVFVTEKEPEILTSAI